MSLSFGGFIEYLYTFTNITPLKYIISITEELDFTVNKNNNNRVRLFRRIWGNEHSDTTIYVKNLNWKTTEEAVRRFFNSVPELKFTTLLQKKKPSGVLLPIRFGFAVYETRAQALRTPN